MEFDWNIDKWGVKTQIIVDRLKNGESGASIARDLGLSQQAVSEIKIKYVNKRGQEVRMIYDWYFDCVCVNSSYRDCYYRSATADTEEKFLQEIKSYSSYILATNYHSATVYLNPLHIQEISHVHLFTRKEL